MSDTRTETFRAVEPVLAQIRAGSGDVQITPSLDDQVRVVLDGTDDQMARARVELSHGTLVVDTDPSPDGVPSAISSLVGLVVGRSSTDVQLQLPAGSRLVLRGGSGDVTVTAPLEEVDIELRSGDLHLSEVSGKARVSTGTGDVRVQRAGSVTIQTTSGDLALDEVGQAAQIVTGTGDVRLDRAGGPVEIKTGSGDLELGQAAGKVTVALGSGDIQVNQMGPGRLEVRSGAGDVTIGVQDGLPVWTDVSTVSGELVSTLPSLGRPEDGASYLELHARTVTGDIRLQTA